MKKAFLINNIEEYGKFISFCIERDVCVFRTFWDERQKNNRCFYINWDEKRCYYSDKSYWVSQGFAIVSPKFYLDQFGSYKIERDNY